VPSPSVRSPNRATLPSTPSHISLSVVQTPRLPPPSPSTRSRSLSPLPHNVSFASITQKNLRDASANPGGHFHHRSRTEKTGTIHRQRQPMATRASFELNSNDNKSDHNCLPLLPYDHPSATGPEWLLLINQYV